MPSMGNELNRLRADALREDAHHGFRAVRPPRFRLRRVRLAVGMRLMSAGLRLIREGR